ncbi:MAG: hypothetical protein WA193_05705 [Candidatus Acidiferrales bacterium]
MESDLQFAIGVAIRISFGVYFQRVTGNFDWGDVAIRKQRGKLKAESGALTFEGAAGWGLPKLEIQIMQKMTIRTGRRRLFCASCGAL